MRAVAPWRGRALLPAPCSVVLVTRVNRPLRRCPPVPQPGPAHTCRSAGLGLTPASGGLKAPVSNQGAHGLPPLQVGSGPPSSRLPHIPQAVLNYWRTWELQWANWHPRMCPHRTRVTCECGLIWNTVLTDGPELRQGQPEVRAGPESDGCSPGTRAPSRPPQELALLRPCLQTSGPQDWEGTDFCWLKPPRVVLCPGRPRSQHGCHPNLFQWELGTGCPSQPELQGKEDWEQMAGGRETPMGSLGGPGWPRPPPT